jgi:hypothetical protein
MSRAFFNSDSWFVVRSAFRCDLSSVTLMTTEIDEPQDTRIHNHNADRFNHSMIVSPSSVLRLKAAMMFQPLSLRGDGGGAPRRASLQLMRQGPIKCVE